MSTTIGTPITKVGKFIRSTPKDRAPKSAAAKAAAAPKAPKAAKVAAPVAQPAKAVRVPKAPKVRKERPMLDTAPGTELVACRAGSFVSWLCDVLTRKGGATRTEILAEKDRRGITQAFNRWVVVNFADRHGYGIREDVRDHFIAVLPKGASIPAHKVAEEKAVAAAA